MPISDGEYARQLAERHEYKIRPAVYEAAITANDGLRVHVTIHVPADSDWRNQDEAGDFAQLAAIQAMKNTVKSRQSEEVPF